MCSPVIHFYKHKLEKGMSMPCLYSVTSVCNWNDLEWQWRNSIHSFMLKSLYPFTDKSSCKIQTRETAAVRDCQWSHKLDSEIEIGVRPITETFIDFVAMKHLWRKHTHIIHVSSWHKIKRDFMKGDIFIHFKRQCVCSLKCPWAK